MNSLLTIRSATVQRLRHGRHHSMTAPQGVRRLTLLTAGHRDGATPMVHAGASVKMWGKIVIRSPTLITTCTNTLLLLPLLPLQLLPMNSLLTIRSATVQRLGYTRNQSRIAPQGVR